jgi:NDP-sugar pyrophosphorylase family protein
MGRIDKSDFEYLYESVIHDKKIKSNRIRTEMTNINDLEECGTLYSWPWDFISHIKQILTSQLKLKNKIPNGIKVIGNNPVYIDKTSTIGEGTILDASEGGIYVGPMSTIYQSSINGPAHVGQYSQVKPYSIVSNSYIGNNCRLYQQISPWIFGSLLCR